MHFNWLGLGSATLLQLAFLREKRTEFPMGEIPNGTTKCTKCKYNTEENTSSRLLMTTRRESINTFDSSRAVISLFNKMVKPYKRLQGQGLVKSGLTL